MELVKIFSFSDKKPVFSKTIELFLNFFYGILHYFISCVKLQKNQSIKPNFINNASYLYKEIVNIQYSYFQFVFLILKEIFIFSISVFFSRSLLLKSKPLYSFLCMFLIRIINENNGEEIGIVLKAVTKAVK